MRAGKSAKNNGARARNTRGKKHGNGKEQSGENENTFAKPGKFDHLMEDNSKQTSLQKLHRKIQNDVNQKEEDSPEVSKKEGTGIQKKQADVQSKTDEKTKEKKQSAVIPGTSINPAYNYITSTEGTRLASHPNNWNKSGEYSLLPKGASLRILSTGKKEFFNINSSEKWVNVELFMLPMKKYAGGMKAAFARRTGWVMSKNLALPQIIPDDKKLEPTPDALKGIHYHFQIKKFNLLPPYDKALLDYSMTAGKYDVIPFVREVDGINFVVAYQIMDYSINKPVYTVGPDKIEEFMRDPDHPFDKEDGDEKEQKNKPLEPASNALQGVVPYSSANAPDFPKYSGSMGGNQLKAAPYWLTPWVVKEDGELKVVAYSASDHNLGINEWLVGPDALEEFMTNTNHYVNLREEYKEDFISYEEQEEQFQAIWNQTWMMIEEKKKQQEWDDKHWMAQSQKAVEAAGKGKFSEAFSHLGEAWVGERGALKSSDWYAYAGMSILGSASTRNMAGSKMKKVPSPLSSQKNVNFRPNNITKNKRINLASPERTKHIIKSDFTGGGHSWFGSLKSFVNGVFRKKNMFPFTWSQKKIMHAISEVVVKNKWVQQTGKIGSEFTKSGKPVRFVVDGVYEGVKIRVVTTHTEIITAFPLK